MKLFVVDMRACRWANAVLFTIIAAAFCTQAQAQQCALNGAYRIDIDSSDKLYSVVKGARSRVPFDDQQRFFLDLSTRLTPPDMLAIECRGQRVSIASSAPQK